MNRIPNPPSSPSQKRMLAWADLATAGAVAALGIALAAGSVGIRFGAGYDRIGPRLFPYVVALGLVALGIWLAVGVVRGRHAREERPEHFRTNWAALGWLSVALLASLLLLERAGFVIAASVLFWLAARAFHSRRPWRDAWVAVLLAVVVFFAFTRGLGLTLPPGIFEGLLGQGLFGRGLF